MREIVHARSFKVLLAVVLVLLGMLIFTAGTGSSITASMLSVLSTPMQRVSTLVTNNAAAAAEDIGRSKEDLQAENEELKKQIAELTTQLVDYYDLKKENAQLYKYLDMKEQNPEFTLVSAAVIGRDPNSLNTFKIDKGTAAGVSVNDPVVTESGVVGWVSSANAISAEVTTLLSPDTKIGGRSGADTENGTGAVDRATGDAGVISTNVKLADRGWVKLGFLTADTTAKEGDIVVTSGLGGIYPPNLKIGRITSLQHEEYDVSLYAEVEPFVDISQVKDVMVITSFLGQGESLASGEPAGASSPEEGQ